MLQNPKVRRVLATVTWVAAIGAGVVLVVGDGVPPGPGQWLVDDYFGGEVTAAPVPGTPPRQHPHLAAVGRSGMHGDGDSSDTHPFPGPLGRDPQVTTRRMAAVGGECATVAFDKGGRLVTVCGTVAGFRLKLLDPRSLATLAEHELPQRPSTIEGLKGLDLDKVFTDTSGGAYFYLDDADRAVLVDSDQQLLRVAHRRDAAGTWRFDVTNRWDLRPHVPDDCVRWGHLSPTGECDAVTSVMPDWDGRIWWVTRHGRIGTVNPLTGRVRAIRLKGEEIQNSFSVARDGVSIVSDHALYAFAATADGTPRVVWRQAYDRGTRVKPGSVNQGSGTTPTLLGDAYVAITDNADERMNVLVYRRGAGVVARDRLVCKVPVFSPGASTTDNSLVGWGNSLVVENNYGYRNVTSLTFGRSVAGGATRIDIRPDGRGCTTVWTSPVRSPSTVAKLSVASGLLYYYEKRPIFGVDAWYLSAVDFRDGSTRWSRLTGTGPSFDNNWAPITLGPDGTAYVGVFNGLVAVRDSR